MNTRVIYILMLFGLVGNPFGFAKTQNACDVGPAGPVCHCSLSFPAGCSGDSNASILPCSVDGLVMPNAGSCPTQAATENGKSPRMIDAAPGKWVCSPDGRGKSKLVGSLNRCQNSLGNPFCSCHLKYTEGCGLDTQKKYSVEGDASIESCKVGDGILEKAPCPNGVAGTGRATWICNSLDVKQMLQTCECKLEVEALELCTQCNNNHLETTMGRQCKLLTSEEKYEVESEKNCVLNDTHQQVSVQCPEGSPRAGETLPFTATWACLLQ